MTVQRSLRAAAVSVAAALILSAASALAHHATTAFYDSSKKVEAQGKVTKFVFQNPHAYLFIDAPNASGTIVNWQIELGAPISLKRTGWTPETIQVGTELKVVGAPSRAEGTYGLCCARITRPDGSPIVPGGRVTEERPEDRKEDKK
jgi:hypothetical protein